MGRFPIGGGTGFTFVGGLDQEGVAGAEVAEDFDARIDGHALTDIDPLRGAVMYADNEFPLEGGGDGAGRQDQGRGSAFEGEPGRDEGAGFEQLLVVVHVVFPKFGAGDGVDGAGFAGEGAGEALLGVGVYGKRKVTLAGGGGDIGFGDGYTKPEDVVGLDREQHAARPDECPRVGFTRDDGAVKGGDYVQIPGYFLIGVGLLAYGFVDSAVGGHLVAG